MGADLSEAALTAAEIELKYDGYLAREREAAGRLEELASFTLPHDLRYVELASLSTEARQKLDRIRPASLAQASRIPGVSPERSPQPGDGSPALAAPRRLSSRDTGLFHVKLNTDSQFHVKPPGSFLISH